MKSLILSLIIFFFSTYIYTPIVSDEIDLYANQVDKISNENISVNGDKISFYFNSNYLFSYESINIFNNFDYLINEDKIHIVLKEDNSIKYFVYNDLNKKIKEEEIEISLCPDSNVKIHMSNSSPYILVSSYDSLKEYQEKTNILILRFDDKFNHIENYVFGGYLNECLIDSTLKDNMFYVFLEKEKNSGGDFNNHGNYCLAVIKDGDVVNVLTFDDQYFHNIIFSDEIIRICFDENIYSFDYALNQIEGFKFERESIYSIASFNKMLLTIDESEANIYDIYTKELLYNYKYSSELSEFFIESYYVLDNSIYLIFNNYIEYTYIKLDVFDSRLFVNEVNYLNGLSQYNLNIDSWENSLKCDCDYENINLGVNGTYELKYCFGEYYKIMKVNVLEYQNVFEGGVYPINYELKFSGTAFLNGKIIDYGYILKSPGEYVLEIFDNHKEKREINFIVSKDQLFFELDCFKKSDYVLIEDQSLFINYNIDSKYTVNKVFIDNNEYDLWTLNNNILSIEFIEEDYGFYYHHIDYLILESTNDNKEVLKININEYISFMVLNKALDISLDFSLDKEYFNFNYFLDNEESLRKIKMYINGEFYKDIDFVDSKIKLPHDENVYEVSFNLVYELGDNKLYEHELFYVYFDDVVSSSFALLNISFKEDNLENFNIKINKNKNILKIECQDDLLFRREESNDNNIVYALIFTFIFISLITFIYYFKKIKLNKTRNDKYPLKKL